MAPTPVLDIPEIHVHEALPSVAVQTDRVVLVHKGVQTDSDDMIRTHSTGVNTITHMIIVGTQTDLP